MAIKKAKNAAGDTVWTVRVDAGQKENGKRRQISQSFVREKDAKSWEADVRVKLDRGTFIAPAKVTYGEFLATWLEGRKPPVLRPSTYESYERMIRVHILPTLGHVQLQQLGPERLLALYGALRATLSPRSVQYVHVLIHRSLKDATRWGKVTRNVADLIDGPKVGDQQEMTVWTDEELTKFLAQLDGDALYLPVLLAATTGLRRGEVLGLKWSDVDLVQAEVKVRHTLSAVRDVDTGKHEAVPGSPKTAKGKREVPLLPKVVTMLKVHKMAQGGHGYQDQGYVFTEPSGAPIHPGHFRARFDWRVQKSGLPRIRFHDLRHGFASGLLADGENPVEVSRILGHAKVSTTMNIYAHVMPGRSRALVERLGERLAL